VLDIHLSIYSQSFLDYLVSELEYHYLLKRADSLIDYLDYLDAVVSLNEIRASEEYRKLCK
jgi:hypothetical protein